MALVTTSAVVLRTYPYSETSKIVRLATRDLGVQSAIAKGVLRPRSRFAAGPGGPSEGGEALYPPLPGGGRVASGGAGGGVLGAGWGPPLRGRVPRLPGRAPRDLAALNDQTAELPALAAPHAAAHRRLFARFVRHHFGEASTLP